MLDDNRQLQLGFYIDRTNEAALRYIQSIADDPRLDHLERGAILMEVAKVHAQIVLYLEGGLSIAEATPPAEQSQQAERGTEH